MTYHIIIWEQGIAIELGVFANRKEAKKAMKRYCDYLGWERKCDFEIIEKEEEDEEI
jgi:hypothetical protein